MKDANPTQDWAHRFQKSLPDNWRMGFEQASQWIENNPSRATMIGAAAGFSLGFLGVRRIWKGLDFARRTPLFAGLAFQAASGIKGAFGKKDVQISPSEPF